MTRTEAHVAFHRALENEATQLELHKRSLNTALAFSDRWPADERNAGVFDEEYYRTLKLWLDAIDKTRIAAKAYFAFIEGTAKETE